MAVWSFPHDWTNSLTVTYSFATTVLTTHSGLEQRIATRVEPRKTVATFVTLDRTAYRSFDRFIWTVQASAFSYTDPTTGVTSIVRLADTQAADHPTNGVMVASVTLAADPGTDTYVAPVLDASVSYAGRYVFPFPLEWGGGTPDSVLTPRQTIDYGRGRIAISRPIAFATRTSTLTLQRIGLVEVQALVDFFCYMRGRQGEFWFPLIGDELHVRETVSNVMRVAGTDAAGMYQADSVNTGVRLEMRSGAVYHRRVTAASVLGNDTLLTLDNGIPDITTTPTTVRQASWAKIGRFASDDLTVEWLANPVAQTQVAIQTLPYVSPEVPLFDTATQALLDYYGAGFFGALFSDPLDFIVNVQIPRVGGFYLYEDWYNDGLQYIVNVQIPRDGVQPWRP